MDNHSVHKFAEFIRELMARRLLVLQQAGDFIRHDCARKDKVIAATLGQWVKSSGRKRPKQVFRLLDVVARHVLVLP